MPTDTEHPGDYSPGRRTMVTTSLGLMVGALLPHTALSAPPDPARLAPQPGDELWFPSWETESRAITVPDVQSNSPPLSAVPYDPLAKVLRERSRLNQILLVRHETPSEYADGTDGIIAYSGICTHAACGVSEWNADTKQLICPCHGSAFDPHTGSVTAGPAPRALPRLPIRIAEGKLLVAGPFSASVGAKKT
jgi:rieske iron-sulfur protein